MNPSRLFYVIGFIITALLLGTTFYLQNVEGFTPCPLCILQRVTLCLLSTVFFVGSVLDPQKKGNLFLGLLSALLSLIGIFFSGRQVWLQHFSSDKNADCTASLQYLLHVLPFNQVISKIFQGSGECTKRSWEFLNLSLAEWSLICFIVFFIACLFQARRKKFSTK